MASSRKRIVASAADGEPPKKMLKAVETIRFTVYNFADRKEKRGQSIQSPTLKAHGIDWYIVIYPRGHKDSSTDDEYVSIFLSHTMTTAVTASYRLAFKSASKGWTSKPKKFYIITETNIEEKKYSRWGYKNFRNREHVIANLLEEDGSLVIECDIRIAADPKQVWYPEELQRHEMLVDLFANGSSDTSDVSFSVGKKVFRAHKSILALKCKRLFEIANECEDDTPVPVPSIVAEDLKRILEFIYTVKVPTFKSKKKGFELLVAADRYECTHLKLYVESLLTDKFLAPENAAEMLLFADSHCCALLKEAALELFVTDADTVRGSKFWSQVTESNKLLKEVLKRTMDANKSVDETDVSAWDVVALREELDREGLEIDGSHEMLVDRIIKYRTPQGENQE